MAHERVNTSPKAAEDEDFPPADPIRLTVFTDKFAQVHYELEYTSLGELAAQIQDLDKATKGELPWIKLAQVSGEPSDNGSLRYDDAIVELWGAEGDYDLGVMGIAEAAGKLRAAGIEALLYETASSTPERPRWRVLCWASQGHGGGTDELRRLRACWVARINGVLGGILAGESFTLSQSYYVGGITGQPPIQVIITEGSRIDLRDDLDAGAIYKNGTSKPTDKAHHTRTSPRDRDRDPELIGSDDDPRLLRECESRSEGFRRRWGVGTTPRGARATQLVQWLGDVGTSDDLTPSARMIERVMQQDYPETTVSMIKDILSRRQKPRGWYIVDPAEPEPEPEPQPEPWKMAGSQGQPTDFISLDEAKQKLEAELREVLDTWWFTQRLIKGAMGLGKTDTVLRQVAEMEDPEIDDGQIVYAAQRHELLRDAAEKQRGYLRANGWSEEAIAENVVILQSRHHVGRDKDGNKLEPLCRRYAEAQQVVEHGGSPSESLCYREGNKTRPDQICPFYEGCPYLQMRRKAGRARFVFITHAHLTSPWPPAGRRGVFHPKNAKLVIIDENPISTLFDQEPTLIKAGTFKELVGELGEKIEEALARPDALDFLRGAGVTADQLYVAAEALKRGERRRRIGHPGMTEAERAAEIEKVKKSPPVPHLSRWVRCLADELKSGRPGELHSLRRDSETGNILARARRQLWDTSEQKWLILDGTANVEELRCVLPKIQEVRIEVLRNVITVQVSSNTYSKNTTLENGKPTQLLSEAYNLVEILAKAFPDPVAAFTTKQIRRALTGAAKGEKLDFCEDFRGARLGHYGNLRGSNAFEDCEVGFLIGREEMPVGVIEADARAFWYDTPTPIQFVEPDQKGAKRLENRTAWYTMRDDRRVKARVTRHPDWRCQLRVEAFREAEMQQALDRLRLIHNREPKLVFTLSSVPLPIPVDVLISEDTIANVVEFRDMLVELESAGFGTAAPMTAPFLSECWSRTRGSVEAATYWLRETFPSNIKEFVKASCECAGPDRTTLLALTRSQEALKIFLIHQVLSHAGWELARFKVAGTKASEWSLFVYRAGGDGARVREALAAALKTAPKDISLTTLTGEPFAGSEVASTGDALLDRALAICAEQDMALSLEPERLAALPGSPWKDAKAAKNWKEGIAIAELLKHGPPEGWNRVEYRLASRRGGRASVAWVPEATQPAEAIARALGRSEVEIVILNGAAGAAGVDNRREAA